MWRQQTKTKNQKPKQNKLVNVKWSGVKVSTQIEARWKWETGKWENGKWENGNEYGKTNLTSNKNVYSYVWVVNK